RGLLG
ncbi:hypothetical protein VTL71DRAFT_14611, partial [Oculimacula yallundae]